MTSHSIPGNYRMLQAAADCGNKVFHGWMRASSWSASFRAAIAAESNDVGRFQREDETRNALVPYPWTGIYKPIIWA
jgi:hypothetical protein